MLTDIRFNKKKVNHFQGTTEILNSYLGTEKFLRWNSKVPPLEPKSSSVGTKKFQEGNSFWNSYV